MSYLLSKVTSLIVTWNRKKGKGREKKITSELYALYETHNKHSSPTSTLTMSHSKS